MTVELTFDICFFLDQVAARDRDVVAKDLEIQRLGNTATGAHTSHVTHRNQSCLTDFEIRE